jgi:hypothetical protein
LSRFPAPCGRLFEIPAEALAVRAMAFIWAVVLIGGIAYFSAIGLTHH